MSERKHHHTQGEPTAAETDRAARPYWRRAHHDWKFWVAVFFIFAALAVYIMTVDLSQLPRISSRPQSSAVDVR
jgi:hypothetical protein